MTEQTWRPEIDGLRAIAVLAVVLFHAGAPGFAGGYAGVDVFFVISGYLITQIIIRARDGGGFSFAGFYERRIRRIMPALFAMLAAATLAALVLLPADLVHYGQSLMASIAFIPNLYFWRETGYFQTPDAAWPLLHLWSLGVEEQFYLVYPTVLLVLMRFGRRWAAGALAAVTLASFAFYVWTTRHDATGGFYWPTARGWELSLGCLLALAPPPVLSNRMIADGLAALGLVLIAAFIGFGDVWKVASGPYLLAPCLGAALVIHASQTAGSRVARLLSAGPLTRTGRASYSIYLWHWPLICFGAYYILDPHLLLLARLGLAALSLPIAFVSLRYIEQPLRGPAAAFTRRQIFAVAVGLTLMFAALGAGLSLSHGLPGRFGASRIAQSTSNGARCPPDAPPAFVANQGRRSLLQSEIQTDSCLIGDPSAPLSFVLWGDSHAAVYIGLLDRLARRDGLSGLVATRSACRPVLLSGGKNEADRQCVARNHAVLAKIAQVRPRVVIIAANFTFSKANLAPIVDQIAPTGARVFVVIDPPMLNQRLDLVLMKAAALGMDSRRGPPPDADVEATAAEYADQRKSFMAKIGPLVKQGRLTIIDPGPGLCGAGACAVMAGPSPLYRDKAHLSDQGADFLAPMFAPVMQSARVPGR